MNAKRLVTNRLKELVAEKERLDRREYSYKDIAEKTGVDYRTVSSWMRNKTMNYTGGVIIAFCEWLNCTVGELLVIQEYDDETGQWIPVQELLAA